MSVKGIITPAVTPLKDGKVSEEGIAILLERLKGFGVSGVFPMGSTGLFPLFSKDDHVKIIGLFAKHLPSGLRLFAGISRNNLDETLQVAKATEDYGADFVVAVTPYYIKRSQEDLLNYYKILATSINSKLIVYNIPQFTGINIDPDTLFKISKDAKNVVGIKDSSGNIRLFERYIYERPDGFDVYQGQDDLLLPSKVIGASGGVCGTSNIVDWTVRAWKGESNIAPAIFRLMSALSSVEFPKGYYYLFWRVIMKEEPHGYMPKDMLDLTEDEEGRIYDEFIKIREDVDE